MAIDLRRSTRNQDYLPIIVNAVDSADRTLLAGPFSSRIIDISSHGACLLMTQVFKQRYHVFHTAMDHSSHRLELHIDLPSDQEHYTIIARPIWMDLFRQKEITAFKLGVEFTESLEDGKRREIEKAILKEQKQRSSWWVRACAALEMKNTH